MRALSSESAPNATAEDATESNSTNTALPDLQPSANCTPSTPEPSANGTILDTNSTATNTTRPTTAGGGYQIIWDAQAGKQVGGTPRPADQPEQEPGQQQQEAELDVIVEPEPYFG